MENTEYCECDEPIIDDDGNCTIGIDNNLEKKRRKISNQQWLIYTRYHPQGCLT